MNTPYLPYMFYTLSERLMLANLAEVRANTVTNFIENKLRLDCAQRDGLSQEEIDVLINRSYEMLDVIGEIDACYAQCFIARGGMN